MRIRKPMAVLTASCPTCGQGDALALSVCPNCGWVVAVCTEEGSVYADVDAIDSGGTLDQDSLCPSCGVETVSDFFDATEEHLVDARLGRSAYKLV